MEKIKNRYGITIVVLLIFLLVLGWGCTVAHYNKVIGEKNDKIEMSELQAFEAQTRAEELLGELKDLKEPIFKVYLAWRRTKKVELTASNFHKYYVGIEATPFFRFNAKVWDLIKAYNKVYYPDY